MSSEAVAIVLRAKIDNAATKAVLIGLAEHAGPDGSHSFPSNRRLVVYTSLGLSTVKEKLAELQRDGLIRLANPPRHHTPAEYWINLNALKLMKHPVIQELDGELANTPTSGPENQGASNRPSDGQGARKPSSGGQETGIRGPDERPFNQVLNSINHGSEDQELLDLWKSVVAQAQVEMSRGIFRKRMEPTNLARLEEGLAIATCTTKEDAEFLQDRFAKIAGQVLSVKLRRNITVLFLGPDESYVPVS